MQVADSRSGGELVRVLGIIFGLSAVVGGAVGQGILRTPGIVAGAVPEPAIILVQWAAGGAIATMSALALAELGAAIPHAGGPYVFVRRAFGPTAGTIIGWSDWLNSISAQAFMSVVVAEFVHRLGFLAQVPVALLAPGMIAIFFAVNWTNTRLCGSSQSVGSAMKGACLLLLVLILLLAPAPHRAAVAAAAPPAAAGLGIAFAGVIVAIRAVQNTYDGWNNCIYFCEEMHAPERCIPRALFGGIALVAALYLLVNVALLRILSPAEMASSNFPAADALGAVMGDWADTLLTAFGVISVGAILNLNIMYGPRIALAMARDRVLPRPLAAVAPGGTPRNALIATTLGSAVLSASGTYEQLIAFNVALGVLINLSVGLSALRLRRTEPGLARPWRIPLYPWPVLVAVSINVALLGGLIFEDPVHSLLGTGSAVMIGLGYRMAKRLRPVAVKPA
jgi:APA family basic amino acid/polyamine antiporter